MMEDGLKGISIEKPGEGTRTKDPGAWRILIKKTLEKILQEKYRLPGKKNSSRGSRCPAWKI